MDKWNSLSSADQQSLIIAIVGIAVIMLLTALLVVLYIKFVQWLGKYFGVKMKNKLITYKNKEKLNKDKQQE